jgi:hypothetical protein
LIGGQALNFWAEQYSGRAEALADQGPFASKDVDFCGTQDDVRRCAAAVGGKPTYQPTDAHSLCVGVVHYIDVHEEPRQLDFLSKPFGLETEPVSDMSFPVDVTGTGGATARIRVMHPLHCWMSRVANVGGLEKYRTDHGFRQLRASILCMRAFLGGLLDEGEENVRPVLKLNESIFRFSVASEYAEFVRREYGIEPFEAALISDARLPEKFRNVRVPQMAAKIAAATEIAPAGNS